MNSNQHFHFYQPDLILHYRNGIFKPMQFSKPDNMYYILVMLSGKAKVEYADKIVYLKEGDTFFAHRNEAFSVSVPSKHIEYFDICFEAKFFHELDEKVDVLKPFSYADKDSLKIYNEETENEHYQSAVKNVIRAMMMQSSRAPVMSAVLQLVCEIYYIHCKNLPEEYLDTDSSFAKLYKYMDNHLYEKMTLKSVSEGTFMSERNITYLMRKIVGMSFNESITAMRLDRAIKLLGGGDSIVTVASRCGFDTYSTFYRAFKKKYGVSPKEYIAEKRSRGNDEE